MNPSTPAPRQASRAESGFFSPRRFMRLLRQQCSEHARGWALFALGTAVLLALLCGVVIGNSHSDTMIRDEQAAIYWAGLLTSAPAFAARVHGAWRSREAALLYLMLPASTFEKWLLSALLLLLAWPLAYTLLAMPIHALGAQVGYALDAAYHASLNNLGPAPNPADYRLFWPFAAPQRASSAAPATGTQAMLALIYAMLTGYTSFMLVHMRRHAAARALVLAIVLALLALLLNQMGGDEGLWVLGLWFRGTPAGLPWGAHLANALLWLGVPALLWLALWRALHEKDVA